MIEYTINKNNPSPEITHKIAMAIENGKIAVIPFDTSYGIAANYKNTLAADKIYEIKERPKSKEFPVVMRDLEMIEKHCQIDENIKSILEKYLPGMITFILKLKTPDDAGRDTIAVRIPDNPITKQISQILDFPYTATSANPANYPPAYTTEEVYQYFGKHKPQPDIFLNAGALEKISSSTIVDLTTKTPKIIRQGPVEFKP